MVKIVHYEVYADKGDGWRLEERFSSEQRHEAINLAKEIESDKYKVKIIKETFDVQDNSYIEATEYVGGLGSGKTAISSPNVSAAALRGEMAAVNRAPVSKPEIFSAILKLISIIILCLVFAIVLVTLLIPVVEAFASEEVTKPLLFLIFFAIFLGIAVPLVMKKVPWHVFTARTVKRAPLSEKTLYDKAQAIVRQYGLNDEFETSIAPVFPEAPLEYKRHIVSFLSEIIAGLDSGTSLQSSFSRLGVKLIVYGGCLELSRYSGLKITEANSLLYEAFKIIDGDNPDLEAFYDAKKSYRDNKVAVFLAGVGAFLMAQVIEERPRDTNILRITFDKWERLNRNSAEETAAALVEFDNKTEEDVVFSSQVNIKSTIQFFDQAIPGLEDDKARIRSEIRNIIFNLINKFSGGTTIEDNGITSVEFLKLTNAVRFAVEFYKDISIYQEELEDENLIFNNRCTIIPARKNEEINLSSYVDDLFEHTYDDEIIITPEIKDALEDSKYSFEFLGEKKLEKTGTLIALYKLQYEK